MHKPRRSLIIDLCASHQTRSYLLVVSSYRAESSGGAERKHSGEGAEDQHHRLQRDGLSEAA